jgi:hypothetical protein
LDTLKKFEKEMLYYKDDFISIPYSISTLCGRKEECPDSASDIKSKDEPDIIDLTMDDDDDLVVAGPSSTPQPEVAPVQPLSQLAYDDSDASIEELLHCLTVTELTKLAKQMKVKVSGNVRPMTLSLITCILGSHCIMGRELRSRAQYWPVLRASPHYHS